MIDIEGILEEVVVKVIGHASRKNAFWLISMDRDCTRVLVSIRLIIQERIYFLFSFFVSVSEVQ
jgi:hypothetical protein